VTHIISPKSWLKSFRRLGDPGMTLGRCSCEFSVFCAVHPRTVCACLADSPWLADSPRGVADRSADYLDRTCVFGWWRLLYCGPSAPCLPDSPPLLWRIVRGSQADSLICMLILAKFDRFLCFFSSASACVSRNRS
jgi:hypothetical protein